MALYAGAFDPASPTTNLLACNDDYGGNQAQITASLTGGQLYTIVLTTYDGIATGDVALDVTAPMAMFAVGATTLSTTAGTAFSQALTVEVRAPTGEVVAPGTVVTFSAPSSGATATLSATTATTDTAGRASVSATASTTAGSYKVTASVDGGATTLDFELTNSAGPVAAISIVSGASQSALVGTAFSSALAVRVVDQYANGISGVSVAFGGPSNEVGAVLSSSTVTTNATGQASVTATAKTGVGAYTVTATVTGFGTPASFALTNLCGPAANVAIVLGDAQSAVVGRSFASALTVRVTDSFGNVVPNSTVAFSAPSTGASASLSAATVVANDQGKASVSATASTTAGSYSITASVTGATSSASFSLTNTPSTAVVVVVASGSNQSATVGAAFATSLTARVDDAYGNAVPGVLLTFSAPGSGATAILSTPTGTTDSQGKASVTATASTVSGAYAVSVTAQGVGSPATFSLNNLPGLASRVTALSGGGQSATVGVAFATALLVSVTDGNGNRVPNATVTFSPPASGATATFAAPIVTTNAQGEASVVATAGRTTGAYSVTVTAAGATQSATFSLTNTPGAPVGLTVASGSAQSARVENQFALPLTARVRDTYGNAVPGVTVTFHLPQSAANATLSASSLTTNAQGDAAPTATANSVVGTYMVAARVSGLTDANFSLTNTAGTAASVSVVGGSNQTAAVSTAFTSALAVRVVDSFGNPVPGTAVHFAIPSGQVSATISATVATTDGTGQASVTATAKTAVGTYAVTASVTGVSASASFALTNSAGAAASITLVSGSSQHAVVAQSFTLPIVVRLSDSYGNPVPNASVSFTKPSTEPTATLSAASAATNAQGQASVTVTASTIAGSYSIGASASGVTSSVSFAMSNDPGTATAVVVSSGSDQASVVMRAFAAPFVARAVDAYGNGVSGVSLTFSAPTSDASVNLSSRTVSTNGQGLASVTGTANSKVGSYYVYASAEGIATSARFSLRNAAGAPSNIVATGGTGQTATVAAQFPIALSVSVTDVYNNRVPDAVVTFTAPATGASALLASNTAVTDATGAASVTAIAGHTAGKYSVSAVVGSLATTVNFSLTNTPGGAAAVAATHGNGQVADVGEEFSAALVATVSDVYGNPVPNVTVTFAAPALEASAVLSSTSATSNSLGQAAVQAMANSKTGSYSVTAVVSGILDPASFALTNTSSSPARVAIVSGSDQTARVNAPFGAPLRVVVRDAQDNLVPNALVSFEVPPSGAGVVLSAATATTNAQGEASVFATANTIAGTYSVTAKSQKATLSATFQLTNRPGAAVLVGAQPGNSPQTAMVGTSYTLPLTALVLDAYGNTVPDVVVTYAAPSTGATAGLSAATATTDAQGKAEVAAAANTVAGTYSVVATVDGLTPVTFRLTNSPGVPGSIVATGGSEQSATVGGPFAHPLQVLVADSFANAVSGASVTFAMPLLGAAATISAATVTTDAAGKATIDVAANTIAGTYWITASVPGAATPVVFSLTNMAGPAVSITMTGNSTPQSARVATPFAQSLQTLVRDAYGNLVPGHEVTFAAPESGASAVLSSAAVTTNAQGQAVVQATANGAAGVYRVTATAKGLAPVAFDLVNMAGDPGTIAVLAGGSQSAVAQTAFAASLSVVVRDSLGNVVPGAAVTFRGPISGAGAVLEGATVSTGANGQAEARATANTAAGAYSIVASVSGAATPASFALTNLPAAAHTVTAASESSPQTAQVLTAFARPLEVVVADAFGNPVPSAVVTFAAPSGDSSAALSSSSATTNASGRASITAEAKTVTGTYSVSASVEALLPTAFSLTNSAGPPHTIEAVSGGTQSAVVASDFSKALVALVRDRQNNLVPGATVQFAAPETGASAVVKGIPATTGVNGQASVTISANTVAGTYRVTAGGTGIASAAEFALTNLPGSAATLSAGPGATPQSTLVSSPFGNALIVIVSDQFGNPVPSTWVLFSAPPSGPSASLSTMAATTNEAGRASATATANAVAGPYIVVAAANGIVSPLSFSLTNTVIACTLQLSVAASSTPTAPAVTVVVSPASTSAGKPTGSVRLVEGVTEIAVATLDGGKATVGLQLSDGTHSIVAMYEGNGAFDKAQSTALSITVGNVNRADAGDGGGADAGTKPGLDASSDAKPTPDASGRDADASGRDVVSSDVTSRSDASLSEGSTGAGDDPVRITDITGSGISCRVSTAPNRTQGSMAWALIGLAALVSRRRRQRS